MESNTLAAAGAAPAARRLVIGVTGASGQIYAARIIEVVRHLQTAASAEAGAPGAPASAPRIDLDLIFTDTARQVYPHETGLPLPVGLTPNDTYYNRNASGSNAPDAFIIIPCTMGTLARIAAGTSDDLICRVADVQLKERRPLIIVPRETPYSLIHLRNMTTLTEAGAIIAPASPAFYSLAPAAGSTARPTASSTADSTTGSTAAQPAAQDSLDQLVIQFVYRILALAGISPLPDAQRWMK